jgi:photosynthetic reaction center cytochrome c subunit
MSALRKRLLLVSWAVAALLAGCERPPMDAVQLGYRGTGIQHVSNPRVIAPVVAANQSPEASPAIPPAGTLAKDTYKNVKVLGDLDVSAFTRLMVSITQWVAPEQGCVYCHNPAAFEDDSLYTKIVARRMLEMTRHINTDWKTHVAATGVTCYTCHRGQPVPKYVWYSQEGGTQLTAYMGNREGQNAPSSTVAYASLPNNPYDPYLRRPDGTPVRVQSEKALPDGKFGSVQQTEATYGLMMQISQALGVNCTFCHNSRAFESWEQSSPQRVTAWHGLAMVRDVNSAYLDPLGATFPPARLDPHGDAPKASCATCHQGAYKPLYGVSLLKDYPELAATPPKAPEPAAAPPADAAPAAAPSADAAPAAPADSAAPAPAAAAAAAPLGKVLFDVGKADIGPDGQKAIADAAKTMKENAAIKVMLSGFADKSGNADQNLELAKKRAMAVRDALAAAGVEQARIELKKPEFVIGGLEADSRRVDIVPATQNP